MHIHILDLICAQQIACDAAPATLPYVAYLATRRTRRELGHGMLRATNIHSTQRLQALHTQLLGPVQSDATASNAPKKVRLAFIGCGQICHAHLNGLNALAAEHIQVTVCIDPSERAEEVAALVSKTEAGGGSRPQTFVSCQLPSSCTGVSTNIVHKALKGFALGAHRPPLAARWLLGPTSTPSISCCPITCTVQ